jgi:xylulokinase
MPDLLIGHDVGTGGSKAVLADTDGNILARAFEPYGVDFPQPHWAEQDPATWWNAVARNSRRVLADSGIDPAEVRGMGFAGQMIGVIPVDAAGKPLRPAIIWMDSRADDQASRLIRKLGGERIFTLVAGALPTGKDVVCKIAWLQENEPALMEKTEAILDVTGYLVARATGELVIDHSGAGGTGLLTKSRQWSSLLARICNVPLSKMPAIRRSIDVVGGLTAAAAGDTGLPQGTPIIAGMADIPAAATGSGALEDGDAHIYLGTSSWLCLSVAKAKNLPKNGIVSVASPDPAMHIMIGESETAGICLEWFADNLAMPSEKEAAGPDEMAIYGVLDQVASGIAPGSDRLIFMPWLFGERAPVGDTTLRGAFVNLSLEHSREHMLRAVYEGIAYNLRWMIDEVARAGFPARSLRAIGGGAKSDLWMQVMADVTGRKVEAVDKPQEAGALGCALAVAVALGIFSDYKEIKRVVKLRGTFEPEEARSADYQKLYENFRGLYPALSRAGRDLNR